MQANKVGLEINSQKTKTLLVQEEDGTDIPVIGNKPLERVQSFCYLGSILTGAGGTDEDIKERIKKAGQMFSAIQKIWSSNNISQKTKIKLFKSNIKSVLLYACESWALTDLLERRIQEEKKFLRIF